MEGTDRINEMYHKRKLEEVNNDLQEFVEKGGPGSGIKGHTTAKKPGEGGAAKLESLIGAANDYSAKHVGGEDTKNVINAKEKLTSAMQAFKENPGPDTKAEVRIAAKALQGHLDAAGGIRAKKSQEFAGKGKDAEGQLGPSVTKWSKELGPDASKDTISQAYSDLSNLAHHMSNAPESATKEAGIKLSKLTFQLRGADAATAQGVMKKIKALADKHSKGEIKSTGEGRKIPPSDGPEPKKGKSPEEKKAARRERSKKRKEARKTAASKDPGMSASPEKRAEVAKKGTEAEHKFFGAVDKWSGTLGKNPSKENISAAYKEISELAHHMGNAPESATKEVGIKLSKLAFQLRGEADGAKAQATMKKIEDLAGKHSRGEIKSTGKGRKIGPSD